MERNTLYYGDNLKILREYIPDESIDLIYLDPPFNSQQSYNVLFASPKGQPAEAQITAFEDTWHWGDQAEQEFYEIMRSGHTDVAEIMKSLRSVLKENDVMAYLTMMANRLLELHRVLKPTGSIYLHCDPTASHYLKIVLDQVFGPTQFRNEIIWKRADPKGHAFTRYPSTHDVILFYSKTDKATWNTPYADYNDDYLESHYSGVEAETGRRYTLSDVTNPNKNRPNLTYEWNGITKVWRWTKERMQRAHDEGRLVYSKSGMPRYKRYLDEMKGTPVTTIWTDIPFVNSQAKERLGYPTQKPVKLLERIIKASSNPGDVVLDPFCGCGTATYAAQMTGRRWIGIDITHLAIRLIEKRLRAAFPDIEFVIEGTPKDLESARDLAERDKYQFQWWACSLVDAQPYKGKRKGADQGIDGLIYITDIVNQKPKTQKIIVSVKGGERVGVSMIRELDSIIRQNDAVMGFFITLAQPTQPMIVEAAKAGFYIAGNGQSYRRIQILTIEGLLSQAERPDYVDYKHGENTFKKAQLVENLPKQQDLL